MTEGCSIYILHKQKQEERERNKQLQQGIQKRLAMQIQSLKGVLTEVTLITLKYAFFYVLYLNVIQITTDNIQYM